ncbi:MAG: hypothetical protein MUF49_07250 [Oculatellaceae cyanobacterium Prado106]|jgi:DNA-binding response OmpR family regulator|nr:hypothetical protein [Oculatellaceae cyanobacterium Prado106]
MLTFPTLEHELEAVSEDSPLIVIAEENPRMRQCIGEVMQQEGYRYIEVDSYCRCLETCLQVQPNLVLLGHLGSDSLTCCLENHNAKPISRLFMMSVSEKSV